MNWLEQAVTFQEQENYAQALLAINQYLSEAPEDRDSQLLLALIYSEIENYEAAFEVLESIKPKNDDDPEYQAVYYTLLGNTYQEKGMFVEAIKCYDHIIFLFPEDSTAYLAKGTALTIMGKFQEAKKVLLKASRMEDGAEEAYYNMALIYRGELKLEKAKKFCKKSLDINAEDEEVQHVYQDILDALALKTKIGGTTL